MIDYIILKGVTHYREDTASNNLLYGIIDFFNWGFLEIGAFQNIYPGIDGALGGKRSRLRCVNDPNFTTNTVWEGFRGNWVWESGLSFGTEPVRPSLVYINSNLYTNTVSEGLTWYVDYPRGRVVFSSGISPSNTVETFFAPKNVCFISANHPYARNLMSAYGSQQIQRSDFLAQGSGSWNELGDTRLQLPIVAIRLINNSFKPYEIGGGQYNDISVQFHVFGDNEPEVVQIRDIIANQNNRSIWIPNRARMKEDARWPLNLDYRGALVNNAMMYPDIVGPSGFRWNGVYFTDGRWTDLMPRNGLYSSVVEFTTEIIIENI